MGESVRDPAYTAGQYDPTPAGDGYIRGTWDEVERALLAGRITDEEYERMARTAPVLRPETEET